MNHLRDEITDAVIELVFTTCPTHTEQDFRALVHRVLQIVDYAVAEVLRDERTRRHHKSFQRSKN